MKIETLVRRPPRLRPEVGFPRRIHRAPSMQRAAVSMAIGVTTNTATNAGDLRRASPLNPGLPVRSPASRAGLAPNLQRAPNAQARLLRRVRRNGRSRRAATTRRGRRRFSSPRFLVFFKTQESKEPRLCRNYDREESSHREQPVSEPISRAISHSRGVKTESSSLVSR